MAKKELEIKDYLNTFSETMSDSYNRLAWALRFRSGDQWDDDLAKSRESAKRPTYVVNITDAYCNRIVSPVKKHPLGMNVSMGEEDLTQVFQSRLREIENQSNASGVYAQGYDTAVTGGRGFWVVTKDYKGNTFDQDIFLEFIQDPTSVLIDPASVCPAGEDAEWGAWVKYTDADKAEELYGPTIKGGEFTIYENFTPPEGTVCDMVFYIKRYRQRTIYLLESGEVVDEKPTSFIEGETAYIDKRVVEDPYICVHHYIGDMEIEEDYTELECSYIPVIPVYGQTYYRSDRRIDYRGVSQILEDVQKGRNFFYSNELEQAATAPKVKWLMAEGQEEGHEPRWANANTTNFPYLLYKQTDTDGKPAPVPQRIDSNANLAPMIQAQQALDELAGRVTGIFDPMLGGMMGNDSGFSRSLALQEGELSTLQFYHNLELSIKQTTRVCLELLIRDLGPQMYKFRDENGDVEERELDFGELGVQMEDLDVSTSAGPMYANQKQASLIALESFGASDPETRFIMRDKIMALQDFDGATELAERFKKMLPPELQDQDAEAPDPEAMQALQAQEQAMAEMEQAHQAQSANYIRLIEQLQNELQSREQDNATKLAVEQMKQEAETARNTQDNLTDIAEAEIKQGQEINKEEIKQVGETMRATIQQVTTSEPTPISSDIEPTPNLSSPVIGGAQLNED